VRAYFRLNGLDLKRKFPWFALYPRVPVYPEAHFDGQEPMVSLPSGYPFWTVLMLVGIAALAWPRRPDALAGLRVPAVGAAVGFVPTMISAGLTLRYLHDFFPFVAIASAVGMQQLLVLQPRVRPIRAALPLLAVLALYTCVVSVLITVSQDRW
jgi:hypothetical protein